MTVAPELQPRWRPEDWNPSEAQFGSAISAVKYAVEHMCRGKGQLAIGSLQSARDQMPDGVLAGMAVMFGAHLLAHPAMNERFWRLRKTLDAIPQAEQRAIYVEALGLMSAFAERDAPRRDEICGPSVIPPLRICQAVISISALLLSDQDAEAWLEDWEWTLIRIWGPGPYANGSEGDKR
jgi:hypothetical protein